MSSMLKLVLWLAVIGLVSIKVNGMWDAFMAPMDLDGNGVLEGDLEMMELKISLMQAGESESSAQQAIDSADTDNDGQISPEEYGDMRMNMLF